VTKQIVFTSDTLARAGDICKTAEEEVQNLTNTFIRKIDELLVVKEAEIMKV
jgi:ribosome recycling factor